MTHSNEWSIFLAKKQQGLSPRPLTQLAVLGFQKFPHKSFFLTVEPPTTHTSFESSRRNKATLSGLVASKPQELILFAVF